MDFSALPIAGIPAAPLTLPAQTAAVPAAERRLLPLPQRLTLNPSISAKANYYDLAQTRRAPYDLRSALIWLCLCAHDNSVWWSARPADHQDGQDDAPLPLALDFGAWMRYIQTWQNETFRYDEEAAIEALALRVWIGAHETTTIPEPPDPADQKKTPDPGPTGPSFTRGPSAAAVETPASAPASSTPCPSATSTPPSIHGSLPTESPHSAPEKTPAETPRSTPSSPPPPPDCPYCVPGVDNCTHRQDSGQPFWVAEHIDPTIVFEGTPYAAYIDEHGFIRVTNNIHRALRFQTEAECGHWLRGRRNADNFVARDHLCLDAPPKPDRYWVAKAATCQNGIPIYLFNKDGSTTTRLENAYTFPDFIPIAQWMESTGRPGAWIPLEVEKHPDGFLTIKAL